MPPEIQITWAFKWLNTHTYIDLTERRTFIETYARSVFFDMDSYNWFSLNHLFESLLPQPIIALRLVKSLTGSMFNLNQIAKSDWLIGVDHSKKNTLNKRNTNASSNGFVLDNECFGIFFLDLSCAQIFTYSFLFELTPQLLGINHPQFEPFIQALYASKRVWNVYFGISSNATASTSRVGGSTPLFHV